MARPTFSAVVALTLAASAAALPPHGPPHHEDPPRHPSGAHNGQCQEFNIPIHVKATAYDLGFPSITNRYEVTQWTVSGDTWTTKQPTSLEKIPIDETFNIYGQLCVPHRGAKKDILHLATHGVAFDSRYWDVSIDPAQYSYVYNALETGYSILTYDRLTVGKSDKPDGYVKSQGSVQVEILRGLTEKVRSGELYKHIKGLHSKPKFRSIVHVGHSFGSFTTNAMLALYGHLSDAAILTGYIPTSHASLGLTSIGFDFARTNDPKFADRPDGYVVPARDVNVQTGFFSALEDTKLNVGGFDPALLENANRTKQPGAVSELASLALLTNYGPAKDFRGPVQFMEAEFDFLLCGGDCHDYNQTAIDLTYANAKARDVYLQPGTGHGLTSHRNASMGYKVSFDFLDRHGL